MGEPAVVIYTQSGCADSARVRDWLIRRGIPFHEHNVTDDPAAMQELASRRVFATPLVVIGERQILGYQSGEFEAALSRTR